MAQRTQAYRLSFAPGDQQPEITPQVLQEIRAASMVAIDTETTGLEYDSRILGISVAWRTAGSMHSLYANIGHPGSLFAVRVDQEIVQGLVDAVFEPDRDVALLNAVFDLERLARWGYIQQLPHPTRLIDVQVLARWCLSFEIHEGVSMEKLVTRLLGGLEPWVHTMKGMRSQLASLPAEKVEPYARGDAEYTLMLAEDLLQLCGSEYDTSTMEYLLPREGRFLWLLTRIQMHGIRLNIPEIQRRSQEMRSRVHELRDLLAAQGITNPDSREQLQRALPDSVMRSLPLTEKGNYRLDNETLKGRGPLTAAILEHRSLTKALSTWLDGFINKVASDGRIHPRFAAAGTVSGRLSCSEPNLQAVPLSDRGAAFGDMSGIFMADPGYSLLAADYEQAELRICAAYAKSRAMATAFHRGEDIHRAAAQAMWPDREIDQELRQLGKRCNYCTTYGGGYRALAENTGITEQEAKVLINTYRRAFPELVAAQNQAGSTWTTKGYIQLWNGRRHYKAQSDGDYKAFNQVMQGNVAELVKDAMLNIDAAFQSEGLGGIILQIHDSIEVEVPTEAIPRVSEVMRTAMLAAAPERIMHRPDPPITMDMALEVWYPK